MILAKFVGGGGGISRTKRWIGSAGHSSVSISTTERLVTLLEASLELDPRRATVTKLRSLVRLELLSSAVSEVPLGGGVETGVVWTERSSSTWTTSTMSWASAVSEQEEAPSVSELKVTVGVVAADDDGGGGGSALRYGGLRASSCARFSTFRDGKSSKSKKSKIGGPEAAPSKGLETPGGLVLAACPAAT